MVDKTEISAIGIPGGDCECWCLDVTEEEYIRIKGKKDHKLEKSMEDEFYKPKWKIYPDDLTGDVKDKKVKITVIVEEIDE